MAAAVQWPKPGFPWKCHGFYVMGTYSNLNEHSETEETQPEPGWESGGPWEVTLPRPILDWELPFRAGYVVSRGDIFWRRSQVLVWILRGRDK